MLQAMKVASDTVEPWFPPHVGPQKTTYTQYDTLLPGAASKAVPQVDCEGATQPKARQGAKHLCFFAQLAFTEE